VQEFATEASDEQGHPSFFIDFHSLLEMAAAHACRNKLRYGSTSTTATDGLRPSATVSHAEPHLHFIREIQTNMLLWLSIVDFFLF
jgi:hypothetical protein